MERIYVTVSTKTDAGPLSGVRVLDLSAVVLGPMGTQVLADMGADVIKIESPEGDLMRANGVVEVPGMSSIFLALNRNKRSVVLDLKTEAGRAALRRLIPTVDVLVHNMRVSAIERLGFGYDAVRALNPEIVYCAATGFGQDGPDREKPAFDDIIQAACGFVGAASINTDEPDYLPSLIADKTTGLAVANAVLGALFHRERHGRGQYVEVPMLETMAAFVLTEHMGGLTYPGSKTKAGYARLLEGGRKPVRTKDGWMSLLPYTDKHWKAFFHEVDRDDLGERYNIASRADRNAHIKTLYSHLRELAPLRTTAQWMKLCEQLDIPATPIYSLEALPEHPHLKAVGLFQESKHPVVGTIREIRPTARFAGTPTSIRRPAPTLGRDTAEVLREAGFEESEIKALGGS
ncbi:CoA transferase [Cupriavidus metallidurans]|uniref:CaiB/BaiF CoA transferase family protein n=1 Tax=Cupriavidus TaxID=106589 RepID=UPI0002A2AB40|nr:MULTISPECIES: CoA transferase [Cupriavidus]EKZ95621.1 CoA-transferase [Cupriavidus sp. HMR-1]GMG92313.1 CoA transferase [Cupriavidus sp. TKC]